MNDSLQLSPWLGGTACPQSGRVGSRRSHRPRHPPALAVPRCLRLLPESLRHLPPGGLASPASHSTADAMYGRRSESLYFCHPRAVNGYLPGLREPCGRAGWPVGRPGHNRASGGGRPRAEVSGRLVARKTFCLKYASTGLVDTSVIGLQERRALSQLASFRPKPVDSWRAVPVCVRPRNAIH